MSKLKRACELIRHVHGDVYQGCRPSGDALWELEEILHGLYDVRVPTEGEIEDGNYEAARSDGDSDGK